MCRDGDDRIGWFGLVWGDGGSWIDGWLAALGIRGGGRGVMLGFTALDIWNHCKCVAVPILYFCVVFL